MKQLKLLAIVLIMGILGVNPSFSQEVDELPAAPPGLMVCAEENSYCSFCLFSTDKTDALCYVLPITLDKEGEWPALNSFWLKKKTGVPM